MLTLPLGWARAAHELMRLYATTRSATPSTSDQIARAM